LGVTSDGTRDVLGLWIEQTEGAKFWLRVVNDLKNRGVDDILIAVVDGLKGFPEAIQATFPRTTVQTCIVHLIRNSLAFAGWKERKLVATALRPIYTAPTAEAAAQYLAEFEAGPWGAKFPTIGASWRRAWEHVIPFFAFAPEVRRVIYTTDEIDKGGVFDTIFLARVTAGPRAACRPKALPRCHIRNRASELRHPCLSAWAARAIAPQTGHRNAPLARPSPVRGHERASSCSRPRFL